MSSFKIKRIKINFPYKDKKYQINAATLVPANYKKAIIIANGAGADMDSHFMSWFHLKLASKYYCLKFNFNYQDKGRKFPDPRPLLEATFKGVFEFALKDAQLKSSKFILSGKSMGGRIGSYLTDELKVPKIFFLGYPLHAPGRSDKIRDEHLYDKKAKMLFLSGDRDALCDLGKLNKVINKLPKGEFYLVEGGDHSFKVKKDFDQDKTFDLALARIIKFCG